MLFNSAIFLLFISVLLPLYALVRPNTGRKWLLLAASYIFYANWDYRYVPLLALSTLVDYFAGRNIAATGRLRTRRLWLLASLLTNLGILAIFKYGNFLIETFNPVWGGLGIVMPRLPGQIPVGISFYTFQTLSYTIDIYRRNTTPCRRPLDFALYVSFFAQLVAGPILRSQEFLPQVRTMPALRMERIAEGFQRFILGLFKKVVIADHAGLFVDEIFATPSEYSAITLWCGAAAFAVQVYCDFAGYTDMALGISRAFGFKFPENFDAPFLSRSMTEVWRRWHISLARWLRDYLYIPLGGARCSRPRVYTNLMLTMTLGGLWHGAGWNFVLWGAYHGVILAIERALGYGRTHSGSYSTTLREWIQTAFTLALFVFGLAIFRSDGLVNVGIHVTRMFSAFTWSGGPETRGLFWLAILGTIVLVEHLLRVLRARETLWNRSPSVLQGFVLATLIVLIAYFRVDEIAFVYFQF